MSEDLSRPTDRELIAAFEDGSHPKLTHEQHVRLGYLYLRDSPLTQVLIEFPEKLRFYAGSKGAHDLYHETLTWAWMILIHERIHRRGAGNSWQSFVAANPELLNSSLLDRYYAKPQLDSELARRVFVLPEITAA